MRMMIYKEDLLYAVNAVERAISGKNTLPVLSGILISAEAGRAIFRATDLELAVECAVNAETEVEGSVVLPGRKLAQLVRLLPNGPVQIVADSDQQIEIRYGGSQVFFPQLRPEDFPLLPEPEGELRGNIAAPMLRRMVKQVGIATAADELRPVFTGVLAEFSGNEVTMVATDTHRLTRGRGKWKGEGEQSVIIPSRVLQEVARLALNDEEEVALIVGKNQVFFSFGNLTFTSRLIVGQYPDYQQVIPGKEMFVAQAVVEKQALTETLERAALISQNPAQKNNTVRLTLLEDAVNISAETPDEGRINEQVAAGVSGEKFAINYNVRYLLDALKVMDAERISFDFTGANTPGIILPDGDDEQYLYLLLPVRVGR